MNWQTLTTINGSVGKHGRNVVQDVRVVQHLLNQNLHLLAPVARMIEDGVIGTQTINAILEFQRRVAKLSAPDGRVDPNGATWKKLLENAKPVRPAHVEAFIQKALPAARKVKADWKVPVSICIAQAAHESACGQVVKNSAYFGIKGKSPAGATTTFTTTEFVGGKKITTQDSFRAYKDFDEAADDYGRFLSTNTRYQGCFAYTSDPLKFAEELQKAGYRRHRRQMEGPQ
jgi:hypothetical protein